MNINRILFLFQLSGLLSALIDNIPLTTMMIKIVLVIAESESIKLPIQPLVWAVAFGPVLGGINLNINIFQLNRATKMNVLNMY